MTSNPESNKWVPAGIFRLSFRLSTEKKSGAKTAPPWSRLLDLQNPNCIKRIKQNQLCNAEKYPTDE